MSQQPRPLAPGKEKDFPHAVQILTEPSQKGDTIGRLSGDRDFCARSRACRARAYHQPEYARHPIGWHAGGGSRPGIVRRILSGFLVRNFYVNAIQAERRRQSAATAKAQPMLPGFEHLPARIAIAGKRVALLTANFSTIKAYYWSLMKKHTERKRNDPKIIEAKRLLDEMTKRAPNDKGITVREVLLMDA